jgi:hypothetical protein
MAPANIAAQASPLDRAPPSITIPDLIVIKRGYVRFTCRNIGHCAERSAWTRPKLQSVLGLHIDHMGSYESIWMKKLSAIGPFCVV